MNIVQNKKVTLRNVYLEVGRNCNLRCKHCCKGEPQNVAMSDEVMDALLDNLHFIDEITFSGGEPTLYVERMRTFLDKCKARQIKVNYCNVISNIAVKSEELVQLFNDWIDYCTFGEKNEFTVSTDKFHNESLQERFPGFNFQEHFNWYREKLKPCEMPISRYVDLEYDLFIKDEGRVCEWTEEEKQKFARVEPLRREKHPEDKIFFKNVCQGDECLCGYGCVWNCVRTPYINVHGDVFQDAFVSFKTQAECQEICLGNVLQEPIYDMIHRWNEECDKGENTREENAIIQLLKHYKLAQRIEEDCRQLHEQIMSRDSEYNIRATANRILIQINDVLEEVDSVIENLEAYQKIEQKGEELPEDVKKAFTTVLEKYKGLQESLITGKQWCETVLEVLGADSRTLMKEIVAAVLLAFMEK